MKIKMKKEIHGRKSFKRKKRNAHGLNERQGLHSHEAEGAGDPSGCSKGGPGRAGGGAEGAHGRWEDRCF